MTSQLKIINGYVCKSFYFNFVIKDIIQQEGSGGGLTINTEKILYLFLNFFTYRSDNLTLTLLITTL